MCMYQKSSNVPGREGRRELQDLQTYTLQNSLLLTEALLMWSHSSGLVQAFNECPDLFPRTSPDLYYLWYIETFTSRISSSHLHTLTPGACYIRRWNYKGHSVWRNLQHFMCHQIVQIPRHFSTLLNKLQTLTTKLKIKQYPTKKKKKIINIP